MNDPTGPASPPAIDQPARGAALILCAVSALAALAIGAGSWWSSGPVARPDAWIMLALRHANADAASAGSPLYHVMVCATAIGAFPTLFLVVTFVAGLLALGGRRGAAAGLVVRCGCGMAAAEILKHLVDRPRPTIVEHWTSFSSSSFPSGHSADSTIVYLLLAELAGRRLRTAAERRYVAGCAVALAMLVGTSRVFLGVHWPSDVLGGWAFGSAWVLLCRPREKPPARGVEPSASRA